MNDYDVIIIDRVALRVLAAFRCQYAEAVDELFLTLSPQIAGRAARTNRPGFVQGVEFAPNSAPWYKLVSLKQRAGYLYLRYGFKRGGRTE